MTDVPGDAGPVVGLLMVDGLDHHLFGPAQRARLEVETSAVVPGCSALLRSARNDAAVDAATCDQLASIDVMLTSWGAPRLDDAALAWLPKLRLVAHAAGTVKDIVSDALWTRGIRVTSAAAANALPVAEYTLAAILFSGKDVFARRDRFRDGDTDQLWLGSIDPVGNHGRTVGIIGASLVGRRVIEMVHALGLDLDLVVYDPYLSDEDAAALGIERASLVDVCGRADVLSIHAPLIPETEGMISASHLALLPDGATVINTARGPIIDHAALEAELVSGRLQAVLDVTDPEPLPPTSPLWHLSNVVLTPHVAGAQGNELHRLADSALDEIARFVAGAPLHDEVHAEELARRA